MRRLLRFDPLDVRVLRAVLEPRRPAIPPDDEHLVVAEHLRPALLPTLLRIESPIRITPARYAFGLGGGVRGSLGCDRAMTSPQHRGHPIWANSIRSAGAHLMVFPHVVHRSSRVRGGGDGSIRPSYSICHACGRRPAFADPPILADTLRPPG